MAKQQKTVDYTLPEMLYALRVYKLAAEHHCHLKFTLTQDPESQPYTPIPQGQLAELSDLLDWFMYVPHRFMQKLLGGDEEQKRYCTETLVYAGVKKIMLLLHMQPPAA